MSGVKNVSEADFESMQKIQWGQEFMLICIGMLCRGVKLY